MPANAGVQNHLKILDSRLHGNDAIGGFKTFYETIKIEGQRISHKKPLTKPSPKVVGYHLNQKKFYRNKLRAATPQLKIKLTERSDIHKSSIFNHQSSIFIERSP